jgi:hypothetical protein
MSASREEAAMLLPDRSPQPKRDLEELWPIQAAGHRFRNESSAMAKTS